LRRFHQGVGEISELDSPLIVKLALFLRLGEETWEYVCEEWEYGLVTLIDARGDIFVSVCMLGWSRVCLLDGEIRVNCFHPTH